jgi:hypothetical protein
MRRALFVLLFALVGVGAALILGSTPAGASTDLSDALVQSQQGTNTNQTDQQSQATAETRQLNLNVPISLLSPGSNAGDVDQSNRADTDVISANDNRSEQSIDQTQQGQVEGAGPVGRLQQDQAAANSNETSQDSSAEATTTQANVNVPIAILSPGANSGDVDQSNRADTYVVSYNQNDSDQSVDQTQQGVVEPSDKGHSSCGHGKSRCGHGHHGRDKARGHDRCPCGDRGDDSRMHQKQEAANTNETSQDSSASATTEQTNVNVPISVLGFGVHDVGRYDHGKGPHSMDKGHGQHRPAPHRPSGDVEQSNEADTYVASVNTNDSNQSIDQIQQGWIGGFDRGGSHSGNGCRA